MSALPSLPSLKPALGLEPALVAANERQWPRVSVEQIGRDPHSLRYAVGYRLAHLDPRVTADQDRLAFAKEAVWTALETADVGRNAVANLVAKIFSGITGRRVRSIAPEKFAGMRKVYGSDLLRAMGWKPTGLLGKGAQFLAGLALDIAMDPLTYVPVVGWATKAYVTLERFANAGTKAAEAARLVRQAEHAARNGRALNIFGLIVKPEHAIDAAKAAARKLSELSNEIRVVTPHEGLTDVVNREVIERQVAQHVAEKVGKDAIQDVGLRVGFFRDPLKFPFARILTNLASFPIITSGVAFEHMGEGLIRAAQMVTIHSRRATGLKFLAGEGANHLLRALGETMRIAGGGSFKVGGRKVAVGLTQIGRLIHAPGRLISEAQEKVVDRVFDRLTRAAPGAVPGLMLTRELPRPVQAAIRRAIDMAPDTGTRSLLQSLRTRLQKLVYGTTNPWVLRGLQYAQKLGMAIEAAYVSELRDIRVARRRFNEIINQTLPAGSERLRQEQTDALYTLYVEYSRAFADAANAIEVGRETEGAAHLVSVSKRFERDVRAIAPELDPKDLLSEALDFDLMRKVAEITTEVPEYLQLDVIERFAVEEMLQDVEKMPLEKLKAQAERLGIDVRTPKTVAGKKAAATRAAKAGKRDQASDLLAAAEAEHKKAIAGRLRMFLDVMAGDLDLDLLGHDELRQLLRDSGLWGDYLRESGGSANVDTMREYLRQLMPEQTVAQVAARYTPLQRYSADTLRMLEDVADRAHKVRMTLLRVEDEFGDEAVERFKEVADFRMWQDRSRIIHLVGDLTQRREELVGEIRRLEKLSELSDDDFRKLSALRSELEQLEPVIKRLTNLEKVLANQITDVPTEYRILGMEYHAGEHTFRPGAVVDPRSFIDPDMAALLAPTFAVSHQALRAEKQMGIKATQKISGRSEFGYIKRIMGDDARGRWNRMNSMRVEAALKIADQQGIEAVRAHAEAIRQARSESELIDLLMDVLPEEKVPRTLGGEGQALPRAGGTVGGAGYRRLRFSDYSTPWVNAVAKAALEEPELYLLNPLLLAETRMMEAARAIADRRFLKAALARAQMGDEPDRVVIKLRTGKPPFGYRRVRVRGGAPFRGYAFRRDVADAIEKYHNLMRKPEGLTRAWARFTNIWKELVLATPQYAMVNAAGDIAAMIVGDAFDERVMVDAKDVMRTIYEGLRAQRIMAGLDKGEFIRQQLSRGGSMRKALREWNELTLAHAKLAAKVKVAGRDLGLTYRELYDQLVTRHGLFGRGFAGAASELDKLHYFNDPLGHSLAGAVANRWLTIMGDSSVAWKAAKAPYAIASSSLRAIRAMQTVLEDHRRLTAVLTRMAMHGEDAETAVKHTLRFLFDYTDVTPVEKVFMRSLFPFWSWIRKNTELQWYLAFHRPQYLAVVSKIHGDLESATSEGKRSLPLSLRPKHVLAEFGTQVGPATAGRNPRFINLTRFLPVREIATVLQPIKTLVESAHPGILRPIELTVNRNFYWDDPLLRYPGQKHRFMGMQIDPRLRHLLRAGPLTLADWLSRPTPVEQVEHRPLETFGRVTGLRLYEPDIVRQTRSLGREVSEQIGSVTYDLKRRIRRVVAEGGDPWSDAEVQRLLEIRARLRRATLAYPFDLVARMDRMISEPRRQRVEFLTQRYLAQMHR